jgi:Ca2+-binding RTX toxin-like protein
VATLQGAPALAATDLEVINGSAPGAVITGTAGNDSLTGTLGSDSISALAGNDTIDTVSVSDNPYRFTDARDNGRRRHRRRRLLRLGPRHDRRRRGLDRVVVTFSGDYTLPDGFENVRIAQGADADDVLLLNANECVQRHPPATTRATSSTATGGADRIYSDIYRDSWTAARATTGCTAPAAATR